MCSVRVIKIIVGAIIWGGVRNRRKLLLLLLLRLFCARVQVETRALMANTPLFYNGWGFALGTAMEKEVPWCGIHLN